MDILNLAFQLLMSEDRESKREENARDKLLQDPKKIDEIVGTMAAEVSPSVAAPKKGKYPSLVDAVEAMTPSDHPMKGFAPELKRRFTETLRDQRFKDVPVGEILHGLTGQMMEEPAKPGQASRLEGSHAYKRWADSSWLSSFGLDSEDESVRKLPGYEKWREQVRAAEDRELQKEDWTADATDYGVAVGGGAAIGAALGAFGGGPFAPLTVPAGATLGAVSGAVIETAMHPVRKLIDTTEWARARANTGSPWDKAKILGLKIAPELLLGWKAVDVPLIRAFTVAKAAREVATAAPTAENIIGAARANKEAAKEAAKEAGSIPKVAKRGLGISPELLALLGKKAKTVATPTDYVTSYGKKMAEEATAADATYKARVRDFANQAPGDLRGQEARAAGMEDLLKKYAAKTMDNTSVNEVSSGTRTVEQAMARQTAREIYDGTISEGMVDGYMGELARFASKKNKDLPSMAELGKTAERIETGGRDVAADVLSDMTTPTKYKIPGVKNIANTRKIDWLVNEANKIETSPIVKAHVRPTINEEIRKTAEGTINPTEVMESSVATAKVIAKKAGQATPEEARKADIKVGIPTKKIDEAIAKKEAGPLTDEQKLRAIKRAKSDEEKLLTRNKPKGIPRHVRGENRKQLEELFARKEAELDELAWKKGQKPPIFDLGMEGYKDFMVEMSKVASRAEVVGTASKKPWEKLTVGIPQAMPEFAVKLKNGKVFHGKWGKTESRGRIENVEIASHDELIEHMRSLGIKKTPASKGYWIHGQYTTDLHEASRLALNISEDRYDDAVARLIETGRQKWGRPIKGMQAEARELAASKTTVVPESTFQPVNWDVVKAIEEEMSGDVPVALLREKGLAAYRTEGGNVKISKNLKEVEAAQEGRGGWVQHREESALIEMERIQKAHAAKQITDQEALNKYRELDWAVHNSTNMSDWEAAGVSRELEPLVSKINQRLMDKEPLLGTKVPKTDLGPAAGKSKPIKEVPTEVKPESKLNTVAAMERARKIGDELQAGTLSAKQAKREMQKLSREVRESQHISPEERAIFYKYADKANEGLSKTLKLAAFFTATGAGTLGMTLANPDVSEAGVVTEVAKFLFKGADGAIAKDQVEAAARKLLTEMREKNYNVPRVVADDKYNLGVNEFQRGLQDSPSGGPTKILADRENFIKEKSYKLRYHYMSPAQVSDLVVNTGKDLMNNVGVHKGTFMMAEYNNIRNAFKVLGNIFREGNVKSEVGDITEMFKPLREGMEHQVKYDYAAKRIEHLDSELQTIKSKVNEKPEDIANDIAKNREEWAQRVKEVDEELPFLQKFHQDYNVLAQQAASKYRSAKLFYALDDTADFSKYPFLKEMQFTADDKVLLGRMREQMAVYKQRLKDSDQRTLSGPYAHYSLMKEFDGKKFAELTGSPTAGPYAKFYSRSLNSRPLVPDIMYSSFEYASDIEKRLQVSDFWKQGWGDVERAFQDVKAVKEIFSNLREGTAPQDRTFGNKFASMYTQFEAMHKLWLNPSAGLKHICKLSGDIAARGPIEVGAAVGKAIKNVIWRAADMSPTSRAAMHRMGISEIGQQDKIYKEYMDSLIPIMSHHQRLLEMGIVTKDEYFKNISNVWNKLEGAWGASQTLGSTWINMAELFDRGISAMVGLNIAAKKGMTVEQALYGAVDLISRNNFLYRELNPEWLRSPKSRALFMFQSTPFKIMERRIVNAMRTGKVIKDLGEGIRKASKSEEGLRKVWTDLKNIHRDMKRTEQEWKANIFIHALRSETDFFGTPVVNQFAKDIAVTGAAIIGGQAAGVNLMHHFFHIPFVSGYTSDPTINFSPGIMAVIRGVNQYRRREEGDTEFLFTKVMKKWLGPTGPFPSVFHKMNRLSKNDIPDIYQDNRFQYLFAIPSKHEYGKF